MGLATEVRNGDNCAVLIFVRVASEKHLNAEVYRSRVQDWLYGVRTSAPEKNIQKSIHDEPITEAERLRLVYMMITKPRNEGGAGITPKKDEWENVESIFPLHDHQFNKTWIKEWTQKYFLDIRDLSVIRDRFGEKIAFYFAFLQSYLLFLCFPAIVGFCAWVLLGAYSPIYAVINCLWCVVFVEYWKKQEIDLAFQWGVSGVSKLQQPRPDFKHEGEVTDPVTGEQIKTYSPFKRLSRQLLQIPFALLAAAMLGTLICTCFSIEIFISEVYSGPLKSVLVFLPTVILTVVMPTLTTLLTGFATKLTDMENYETKDAHESAMVQKIFVLNFITSYMPIFLTAFVYVPFATVLVPYLDIFSLTVKPFAENEKQMATPAATVLVVYSGKAKHNLKNQLLMSLTTQILDIVYTEEIREKEGGTYGVSCRGQISNMPNERAMMQIVFQTDPDKREHLTKMAVDLLNKFAEEGPDQKNLDKVREYMLKKYTENQKENAYWGNLMYNYAFTGYDGYKDYEKTLNSITPDDLKKFVKKLLKQGNEIEVSMVGIE